MANECRKVWHVAGFATSAARTAFFTANDTIHGQEMTMIQLIADRNANAVLEIEATWRRAWLDAHPK